VRTSDEKAVGLSVRLSLRLSDCPSNAWIADLEFSRLESWLRLETRFYKSWSWNLRVLDGLGLGTWDSDAFIELHPLLEKVFCPPATSAPVERIFSHSDLLMRANTAKQG